MPKILYKYCDERGTDILRRRHLKITPPNQFNDPFEFAPRMKPSVPRKQAKKAIKNKKFVKSVYDSKKANGSFHGNFREFQRVYKDAEPLLIATMIDSYSDIAAGFRKDAVAMVSAVSGLLCLSSVFDDILMWSHYSHSHCGFVVGLNSQHLFFRSDAELMEVEYNEERVLMGHTSGLSGAEVMALTKVLVRRKSPHWKYENEWRLLCSLSTCAHENDAKGTHHYRGIDETLIAEVILGCRCTALGSEIETLLNQPAHSHVRVRRAAMHDDDFKLVFSG